LSSSLVTTWSPRPGAACVAVADRDAEAVEPFQERDQVHAEFEGCLECGTCIIACLADALDWRYPQAGFGVQYRFG